MNLRRVRIKLFRLSANVFLLPRPGPGGRYGVVTSYASFDHLLDLRLPVVIVAGNFAMSSSCLISSPIFPTSRPMLLASFYTTGTIVPRDLSRGIEFPRSG